VSRPPPRLFQLSRRDDRDVPLQLLIRALTISMTGPDPRALAVLERLTALSASTGDLADVARLFQRLPAGLRRRTGVAAGRLAREVAGRRLLQAGPGV
jgi:hypothetical protein